ncbi:DUF4331 domain-containing protein [Pseudonocardia petroleophila]|uniref:DUF4331 domain-containing protein n=1 Tax=Pseudonocardia petroleophila TaxID=37331 RepID=A0A7G7MPM6_9PSEU|nr:DUF4331 domain-containing protein [Pseudonocardia petroleophila]QNG54737.1 DUF4331 domain-containing protein [Pseudonocardia petroleophila]
MSQSPHRRRAATAMIVAGTTLAATALALVPGGAATASSHREAPLIADAPAYDNTDVYAFVSPENPDKVTFVANWFGLQEPNGGPTFYPWADDAYYNIKIDSDGDAVADTTYRYEFTTDNAAQQNTFLYANGPVESLDDENLLFKQYYTLTKIDAYGVETVVAEGQAAPSNTGPASVPDYDALIEDATEPVGKDGETFVGQIEDPFFLDLRVFDLLYGGDLSEVGQDTLAGYNVNTTVLEVPIDEVALNGDGAANPVIGVWSTTDRAANVTFGGGVEESSGDYVQVSRLGNPLVNEVVIPVGLKDAFNAISPDVDATIPAVVERVTDPEVPKLVEAIYGIPAPATPRNDLVEIFLTGIAIDAPTLDGTAAPIAADLNSQILNADADPKTFMPSEMLRLNTAIKEPTTLAGEPTEASRLGVFGDDIQGFPNGRRLADDVVDIGLLALQGAALDPAVVTGPLSGGDEVDANDKGFDTEFPYVVAASNLNVNDEANSQGDGTVAQGRTNAPATDPASSGGGMFDFLGDLLPGVMTGAAGVVLIGAGAGRHLREK